MKSGLSLQQKYDFYERSVQFPEGEAEFLRNEYKRFFKKAPRTLREDFCGTGAISCAWVAQHRDSVAYGVDLDPEPIAMGRLRHLNKLRPAQQRRMTYLEENVLKSSAPPVDVVCAFNFSYFIFRERRELLRYFKSVRRSLNRDGVFLLDIFAGPESQKLVTDTKKVKNLTYYWECQHFNPLTHECTFAIHFRDGKGKKHENVFTYHWRFWTMPEVRDLLIEAGFSRTIAYWEGDDGKGGGDGDFQPAEDAENCDAWVSYIAALV